MTHRTPSGQFAPAHTPWNKGVPNTGRRHCALKGRCGFQPRPVLLLLPDGTIGARFASVTAAARHLQRAQSTITDSCLRGSLCHNRRLIYEEDYVKWADYSYHPHRGRDARGHFLPGRTNIYRLSPEARQRIADISRRRSKQMVADPSSRWGKPNPDHFIPVLCVETGQSFPSIKDAALAFNIPAYYISQAIARSGTTRHLTFRRITPSSPE